MHVVDLANLMEPPEIGNLTPLPDAGFDRIAGLAGRMLRAPIAFVTVFDVGYQRFIGRHGSLMPGNAIDQTFCQFLMLAPDQELVVQDARQDPRFMRLACAQGERPIRFYAGVPIQANGKVVGTLCVFDFEPRPEFGLVEVSILQDLALLCPQRAEAAPAGAWGGTCPGRAGRRLRAEPGDHGRARRRDLRARP